MCKQALKVGDFFFKMRLNQKVWICQTSLTSYVFRMKARLLFFWQKMFVKNVGLYYRHKVSRQLLHVWGRFGGQKLILSCSFRHDQLLVWIWSHFVVLLKSDFDVKQTHLRGQFVQQMIAPALGVTKLKNVRGMILVTLCCAT